MFFCVLLFFVMFSRLSLSVLTSDIIIFINTAQVAFAVLEVSKIVCHYFPGDMGERGRRISDKW